MRKYDVANSDDVFRGSRVYDALEVYIHPRESVTVVRI